MFFNAAVRGSEEGRFNLAHLMIDEKDGAEVDGAQVDESRSIAQALLDDVGTTSVPAQVLVGWRELQAAVQTTWDRVQHVTGVVSTDDVSIAVVAVLLLGVLLHSYAPDACAGVVAAIAGLGSLFLFLMWARVFPVAVVHAVVE